MLSDDDGRVSDEGRRGHQKSQQTYTLHVFTPNICEGGLKFVLMYVLMEVLTKQAQMGVIQAAVVEGLCSASPIRPEKGCCA
uniref:DNA-directed RNA polymerase n=1 Tax=Panagrellus redivivus TaxID=6233 RepID=A0A7E4ZXB0_PANRE